MKRLLLLLILSCTLLSVCCAETITTIQVERSTKVKINGISFIFKDGCATDSTQVNNQEALIVCDSLTLKIKDGKLYNGDVEVGKLAAGQTVVIEKGVVTIN